jgi:UDP-N-acetylmuramate dehydrogenase
MGTKIGGAQVSDKHCGFIINTGDATASDVIELIKLVQETVYKNTGVSLELEVKIIGGAKYGTTDYNRNVGSR